MSYNGSQAVSAHGTQLLLGTGVVSSEPTYTLISEVGSITGPPFTATVIDVSNQESEGWMEKIIGLKDGGEIGFDINWIPADPTHDLSTGLLYWFTQGLATGFELIIPSNPTVTWEFNCVIKTFTPDFPLNGKLSVKVAMEMTGEPTLTS